MSVPSAPQNAAIEPENGDNQADFDSAFGDDARSELTSITSSITDYVYRNGRRYAGHRDSNYTLPNDEKEQDRNDLVYHIYSMLFGGTLIFADVKSPSRILDVGTGTGIWSMDVADAYPDAEVIGTDISPVQPRWVPPNVQFQIDNAEADWTFERNFSLIHIMNLNGHIMDWNRLLRQSFEHLSPGGWIEVKESDIISISDDNSYPRNCSMRKFQDLCHEACNKIGMRLDTPVHLKEMLTQAGFVDVKEHIFKLPFSPWPKDKELKLIGRYQLMQCLDTLQPYGLGLLVDALGWTKEEMEVLMSGVRNDLKNPKIHGYNLTRVVIGRKPTTDLGN